jgi:outer membrane protein
MRHGIYVLALIGSVPAVAQEVPPEDSIPGVPPETQDLQDADPSARVGRKTQVFDDNYVIVGVGLGGVPDYDGSNDMKLMPAVGVMGRLGGRAFRIRGPNFSFDLIRHSPDSHLRLRLGPTIRYGGNRSGGVDDPVVDLLPKLKSGFEGGFSFGARYRGLINDYDSLSIGGSARWDLSGRHGGMTYGSSISYFTPLSPAQVVGIQAAASWVDDKYSDYNYSVSPEGSAASGLPAYKAKGGLNELSIGAFTARDLSGDFRDGGFALGAGVLYGRLQGSAAATPITSIRGSADQWIAGGGVAYSF